MSGSLQRFDASVGWPALRDRYGRCLSEATLTELDAAVESAVEWHGDQTRPAGEPYVEHLLEALAVLVEGVDVDDRDVLFRQPPRRERAGRGRGDAGVTGLRQ
jgi:guanosine-3',5'-bis(diphosphate) 3'-pyrophosphohydrolase